MPTIQLSKKPKNVTIIEGFPGFGLVGTIATEFLIDHLEVEHIGRILLDELPAVVAVHDGKVVEPIGLFYSKKHNLVILHAITLVNGIEWKVADAVMDVAAQLSAKEIISLEGVGNPQTETSKTYYLSRDPKKHAMFKKLGVEPLKEGIVMGVTGAILIRAEKLPASAIFAETHTELPDSKAAAKILEVLNKLLGLGLDYKPLLEQAEKFEQKLKDLLAKSKETQDMQDKKKLSYVG
ncbi:proteasome assembly chaperone family protein [Candidatus Woesearchaeota archaeon]|nr:proteasome assembly chaperone family protein [Candidatus Woesearchaeota archaeon]